ncbi:hypothetical protein H1Q59_07245 [Holosporaceae bacterium 'Namur']|nr:hypothetical protein [Holosporaceae bacterium 'Namur']
MDTPIAEAQRAAEIQRERSSSGQVSTLEIDLSKFNNDTQKLIETAKLGYLKGTNLEFRHTALKYLKEFPNRINLIESNKEGIKREVRSYGYYSSELYDLGVIGTWNAQGGWREVYRNEKPKDDEYEQWIEEKINTELNSMKQRLNIFESSTFLPTIVWAVPHKNPTQDRKIISFIYSGKTSEKTVTIPFFDIHKHLIESNWIIRELNHVNKLDHTKNKNYLLAHLLFIVSDRPHSKNEEGKYTGGRRFIDFPVTRPLNILNGFKDSDKNYLGKYHHGDNYDHSEKVLLDHLNKEITNIVALLKHKFMLLNEGNFQNFKIYSINLFLNSVHNVCRGCEERLSKLMISQDEESFLFKLKTQLQQEMLNAILPKRGSIA